MEANGMVVDTCIFIDFLRAKDKTDSLLFRVSDENQICISSVTLYELLMGATSPEKINDIKLLTDEIPVLPFDEIVARESSLTYHKLRKVNKMIDFRDIFIAATCIVNDLPLLTLNKSHFERVKGLKIL